MYSENDNSIEKQQSAKENYGGPCSFSEIAKNILSFLSLFDLLISFSKTDNANIISKSTSKMENNDVERKKGILSSLIQLGMQTCGASLQAVKPMVISLTKQISALLLITWAHAEGALNWVWEQALRAKCATRSLAGKIGNSLAEVISWVWNLVGFLWDLGPSGLLCVCLDILTPNLEGDFQDSSLESTTLPTGFSTSSFPERSSAKFSPTGPRQRSMSEMLCASVGSLRGLLYSSKSHDANIGEDEEMSVQPALVNDPVLKKARQISRTATLLYYKEKAADFPGTLMRRVNRMMHYQVNLSPFEALVAAPSRSRTTTEESQLTGWAEEWDEEGNAVEPFMCSPSSLPPTPHSRKRFMEQSGRVAEDVMFLARAQLRLQHNRQHPQTQDPGTSPHFQCPQDLKGNLTPTASHSGKAHKDGNTMNFLSCMEDKLPSPEFCAAQTPECHQLAVWDPHAKGEGIELAKGLHLAKKQGNVLYSTVRALASIPANVEVYFEIQVEQVSSRLDQSGFKGNGEQGVVGLQAGTGTRQQAMLSIGLSTPSLPLNTLVGAWESSVALSSTGQVFMGARWYNCPGDFSYGWGDTVGVSVYLDASVNVDCWDGEMVPVYLQFAVNGEPIPKNAEYCLEGPLLIPKEKDLFPTVTLQTSDTEVICHFCAEDIKFRPKRFSSCSPDNHSKLNKRGLYALDGSTIMYEEGFM